MLFYFIFAMDCNFYSLFYQIRRFLVPWKKEYKENRRKKKKKKTTEFELISNQSIGLGWWPGWNSVPFFMDPGSVINSSETLSWDYM